MPFLILLSDEQLTGSAKDDPFRLPYILEVRPSPEFNYEAAKQKLLNLDIRSQRGPEILFITPGDDAIDGYDDSTGGARPGRRGRLLSLSSWIDIDSRITVRSKTEY